MKYHGEYSIGKKEDRELLSCGYLSQFYVCPQAQYSSPFLISERERER